MGKQFTSIDELEQWVSENEHLGKINEEHIFSPLRKEFRGGYVTAEIYNRALLIGKTMGYGKSEIACSAIELYNLSELDTIQIYTEEILEIPSENFTVEFRFNYPTELLDISSVAHSNIFVAVILQMWCDRHQVKSSEKYLARANQFNISVSDCQNLVYDSWLLESRKKRLIMSKKLGYLVRDRKV